MIKNFWKWYERNKTLNLGIATFLFTLQLVHLIWLFGDVVYFRLTGNKLFNIDSQNTGPAKIFEIFILVVDYLEIPAILTASLVYVNELRQSFNFKSLLFLLFINSQWLHLFWITDEFVVDMLSNKNTATILPYWLAWLAIIIDYLEVPVIFDTMKKFTISLRKGNIVSALEELKEK